METKLQEIKDKYQEFLDIHLALHDDRRCRAEFYKQHNFTKEYEWLENEIKSVNFVLMRYKELIDELNELLNAWYS